MAYQPTHPHPYLESIDATNPLEKIFSIIINPKDVIVKYDFSIYEMQTVTDSGDETSTKETLVSIYNASHSFAKTEWLYGSESGTLLTVEVPEDAEMSNGNDYQWKVVLHDANGASIESPLYHFSAKAMPIITLDVDDTITTCEHTFKATYSQEQNEPYMYYQYALYRDGILIDETPEKMDSLLSYTYNGFVSGNKYRIDLTIMTSDRKTYKISRVFDVLYETQSSLLVSNVQQISDKNCINIDYSQNLFIKGNTDGEITYDSYVTNPETSENITYATIPEGEAIYYHKINETKPLSFGDSFTVYYSVHFSDLFIGDIICLTDEDTGNTYKVKYDGRNFLYKIGDGKWVSINPYVDANATPQTERVVQPAGTTLKDLNYDALYVLYDKDVINDDSVIMYNDIAANFWWTIVLLPNEVLVYRSQKYSESVVS